MNTVAIVGVGLIGGSFGFAIRRAGFEGRILGVSSDRTLRLALSRGAIDEAADLEAAAARADVIYLSQPVGRILDTLHRIDALVRPGTLITDAGSTKGAIAVVARRVIKSGLFIGGHPMAGKERRGVAEADADLFTGRTYVLCPLDRSDLSTPGARWLLEWVGKIGALPVVFDAEEHDRIVSFTSHLPQLASTALAATVADNLDTEAELQVAGPGLIDSTRLALSSYDLWRDILATNAESIDHALSAFIGKLEHVRENLRTRQLQTEFTRASELADRLRHR